MNEIRMMGLEALGDKLHEEDDRYEDIISNAIIPDDDFVRVKSYTERDFGRENIRAALYKAFNNRD